MAKKTELWWASVGGNKCEPIRVTGSGDNRQFFSIGCAEPHSMEGIELVEQLDGEAPPTPKERARLAKAWERERARTPYAGYRKF